MGLIYPGYNSIKSQVTRKQLPPDITTLMKFPMNQNIIKQKEMKSL